MTTGGAGSAIGLGMQLGGSFATARAQRSAADFNADMLEMRAELGDDQAKDALFRGRIAEQEHRQQVRRVIGSQRASYAGQGVTVGTGSAAAVQTGTQAIGEADALRIRHNAALEAWGYQAAAADSRLQGVITRETGRQQAYGTILTGVSRTAQGFYQVGGDLGPEAG